MQLVVVEEDFSFVNFKNQKIFPLQFGKKKRRRKILDSNNNTGKINRQTPVEERNTTACLVLPPFDIILVVPSTNPPFIKIIRLFLHSTTTWSFFSISNIIWKSPERPKQNMAHKPCFSFPSVCACVFPTPNLNTATVVVRNSNNNNNDDKLRERKGKKKKKGENRFFFFSFFFFFSGPHTAERHPNNQSRWDGEILIADGSIHYDIPMEYYAVISKLHDCDRNTSRWRRRSND